MFFFILVFSFGANASAVSTTAKATSLKTSGFDKVSTSNKRSFLDENSSTTVKLDDSLQSFRRKSSSSLRYSIGMPFDIKAVGPSAQMDWVMSIPKLPLYFSTGVGYTMETRKNAQNQTRNFHYLPLNMSLGFKQRVVNHFSLAAEMGPSLRFTFERGFTPEQAMDYSYLDAQAFFGLTYDWTRAVTESGREIGLRYQRYLGIADKSTSPALAILFAYMAWDI